MEREREMKTKWTFHENGKMGKQRSKVRRVEKLRKKSVWRETKKGKLREKRGPLLSLVYF